MAPPMETVRVNDADRLFAALRSLYPWRAHLDSDEEGNPRGVLLEHDTEATLTGKTCPVCRQREGLHMPGCGGPHASAVEAPVSHTEERVERDNLVAQALATVKRHAEEMVSISRRRDSYHLQQSAGAIEAWRLEAELEALTERAEANTAEAYDTLIDLFTEATRR